MTPQERINFGLAITQEYRSCTFHITVLIEQLSIATQRNIGTIFSESEESVRVSQDLVRRALKAMTPEERHVVALCLTSGAREAVLQQNDFDEGDDERLALLDELFSHVREQIENIDL